MKVYASLGDDIGEGFVWLKNPGLPPRCVVKIRNPATKKVVFCEALQFEENFLKKYNATPRMPITDPESAIVMNAWYRARPGGLDTQKEHSLEVANANWWWGKLRSGVHHPQVIVRVAVWLGVVSVVLGSVGVAPGVVSLYR